MTRYLVHLLGEWHHRADFHGPDILFQSDFERDHYSINQIAIRAYFGVSVVEVSDKILAMPVGHRSSGGAKGKVFVDIRRSSLPVMAR